MAAQQFIQDTFEQGKGILRLSPVFVPRRFSSPGYRLRLHPDDYFALGTQRGAIKGRWFASVIPAMNSPFAPSDEGMSYVAPTQDKKDMFTLKTVTVKDGAAYGCILLQEHGKIGGRDGASVCRRSLSACSTIA